MKAYNYCAIGGNKVNMTCVSFGVGAFSSEDAARNYVTDDFFTTNGTYPQRVQIKDIREVLLQTLLNSVRGEIQ